VVNSLYSARGHLSPLDGVGPASSTSPADRAVPAAVKEVLLALQCDGRGPVDGALSDRAACRPRVAVTALAQGVRSAASSTTSTKARWLPHQSAARYNLYVAPKY